MLMVIPPSHPHFYSNHTLGTYNRNREWISCLTSRLSPPPACHTPAAWWRMPQWERLSLCHWGSDAPLKACHRMASLSKPLKYITNNKMLADLQKHYFQSKNWYKHPPHTHTPMQGSLIFLMLACHVFIWCLQSDGETHPGELLSVAAHSAESPETSCDTLLESL